MINVNILVMKQLQIIIHIREETDLIIEENIKNIKENIKKIKYQKLKEMLELLFY